VGLRPSPGRIPQHPTEYAWDTLVTHVQGPMTATVEDAGLMLAARVGPDDRDPTSLPMEDRDYAAAARARASLAGRRIAWTPDLGGLVPVDPEVRELVGAAARAFAALGAVVEEDTFDASDLRDVIGGTRAFAMIARYADRIDAHGEQMSAPLRRQVADARSFDVRGVARAERLRSAYYQRVRTFLERYEFILTPTSGVPAFRIDQPLPTHIAGRPVARYYDAFLFTYAFSVTGLPAISVPCGFTSTGMPVGLQIIGRRLRDDAVLEAAAAFAAAVPGHYRRPPLDRLPAPGTLGGDLVTPGFTLT
jgi:amidase